MIVYIQLITAGLNTGPFDLYSDVDGFAVAFESGIPRQALIDGYTSMVVPDGSTQIKVQSTGNCENYIIIDINLEPLPTTTTSTTTEAPPTTTTTSTTTEAPKYVSYIVDEIDCPEECVYTTGQILINGVLFFPWAMHTPLPAPGVDPGVFYPEAGDEITINACCYRIGGSGCIAYAGNILIYVDGVSVGDPAGEGCLTYTFTFTGNSNVTIEIVPGCSIK